MELDFFPLLDSKTLNPRVVIQLISSDQRKWDCTLIHYNNKILKRGTRNEFRVSGLTAFFRSQSAKSSNWLRLSKLSKFRFVADIFPSDHLTTSDTWRVLDPIDKSGGVGT
jgi:hypothetical protein